MTLFIHTHLTDIAHTCRALHIHQESHRGRCWQALHRLSWCNTSKRHPSVVDVPTNVTETLEKCYNLWTDYVMAQDIEEEDGRTLSRVGNCYISAYL